MTVFGKIARAGLIVPACIAGALKMLDLDDTSVHTPLLGSDEGSRTATWPTGGIYTGNLVDGEIIEGTGTYTFGDGHTSPETGKFRWINSEGYQGLEMCVKQKFPFRQTWKRMGHGEMSYNSGGKYVGEWKDGKKHGKGEYTRVDGTKYVGDWVADFPCGHGEMSYNSGGKYVGEWKDGKKHGKGEYTRVDGTKYVGDWVADNKHGKGKNTWADGNTYEGAYVKNEKEGQGVFKWSNGVEYSGSWKNGDRHGKGVFTLPDGSTYDGQWIHGREWINGHQFQS